MDRQSITFDDVLIEPKFSVIDSRKDVDLTTTLGDIKLQLPVISANMSSITEDKMALAVAKNGGMSILHRFMSIEKNVEMWNNIFMTLKNRHVDTGGVINVGVSVGVSDDEKERAEALYEADAYIFCVDVAHGAQLSVVKQVQYLKDRFGSNIFLIVGNFATSQSIHDFKNHLTGKAMPDAFKIGIGPGSACTTRLKTGVGIPQLSAILDCVHNLGGSIPIIADGGLRTPGDIAKALAAGADAVMLGGMLAGTDEAPGQTTEHGITYKQYKGSASEGYGNGWKTSEGTEFLVPEKGPVELVLKDIEGGLRSSFTYTGSRNLEQFRSKATLILVSSNTVVENGSHGKPNNK